MYSILKIKTQLNKDQYKNIDCIKNNKESLLSMKETIIILINSYAKQLETANDYIFEIETLRTLNLQLRLTILYLNK